MVVPLDKTLPAALKRAFDEVIPWGEIDATAGQLQRRQFKVYWGRNLRKWPLPERG
jgi:hypothetical protein